MTPPICRCRPCQEYRAMRRLNSKSQRVTPWAQPPLLRAGDIVAPAGLFEDKPSALKAAVMTDLGVCVDGDEGQRLTVYFGVDINGVFIANEDDDAGDDVDDVCRWTGITDAGFQLVRVGRVELDA